MTSNEFLKLQVGLFITDHQDTSNPGNYCMIAEFGPRKIKLQAYGENGQPEHSHPFWVNFSEIKPTAILFASDYRALCRRFV